MINAITNLILLYIVLVNIIGVVIVVIHLNNYAKKKIVKVVMKNHLLHMKNQNIGVKKMKLIQEKYLSHQIKNIGLIVIVVMILKVLYVLLLEIILGVVIVVIHLNSYVKMKNVKCVLKNHLRRMKNQNIGVKKMKLIQEKYLSHQIKNIGLIVIVVMNLKVA